MIRVKCYVPTRQQFVYQFTGFVMERSIVPQDGMKLLLIIVVC